jgi:hypothetical protein
LAFFVALSLMLCHHFYPLLKLHPYTLPKSIFPQTFHFTFWVEWNLKTQTSLLLKLHLLGDNSFGILSSASHLGGLYHGWGGRVGYRTPGCVQVLVSGAEDLARTACSTFPWEWDSVSWRGKVQELAEQNPLILSL